MTVILSFYFIFICFKVHLTPKNVFRFINSEQLNSEIFPALNVALVSYRDMNLQNSNKMTSIQDSAIIFTSIYNTQFTA